ncbi:hypothetical protein [Rummeliibacillus pycnus]|uniref:hypothetical protein n=1 Tax=Rummeliibacillus pycnus TaxID=101070 RepID=UPI000C9ACB35|nr:hypothetical protein [Rummeliibacillus pycnus]
MRLKVFFWTILCSSLTFILSLKILKTFSFMKFSPTGWTKKYHVFSDSHILVKWFILWILILAIAGILFTLAELLKKVRTDFMSLVIAVIIVWGIEWSVQKTIYIHKFSIPLAVVIAIHLLWILETASYHARIRSLVSRNKLSNSSNVLK